jgi:LysM repeat protein
MATPKNGSRTLAFAAAAAAAAAVAYVVLLRPGSAAPASLPAPQPAAEPAAKAEPAEEKRLPHVAPKTAPAPQDPEAVRAARELADAGKWAEARAAIAKVFAGELPDSARADLAALSARVLDRLYAAPDSPDVETYEILQGDTLSRIAAKFKQLKGCYGPILLLNGLTDPSTTLRLGRKIRIPKGTWSIVVDKSLFTLWLCHEGAPLKGYRVAIGADDKTPAAVFTVGTKNPKPSWYPPQEMIADLKKEGVPIPIPYGHAKNPLGEYWVALHHDQYQGFGIHGTNDPGSLGKRASNGCVRMDNREVLMVAWTATPGMVVTILE